MIWQYQKESLHSKHRQGRRASHIGRALLRVEIDLTRANHCPSKGAMIEISAEKGDPRSIVISYGSMPEGSDALLEVSGTYEDIIGEIGSELDDDTICEYDFFRNCWIWIRNSN